jgi:hypothetical protein
MLKHPRVTVREIKSFFAKKHGSWRLFEVRVDGSVADLHELARLNI